MANTNKLLQLLFPTTRYICSFRKPIYIHFLVSSLVICCGLTSQLDAQKLVWHTDATQTLQNTEPGKIVIHVQFDSDFLGDVIDSNEFKNFCQHCLDRPSSEWLSENAVLICEAVGFPSQIKLDFGKSDQAPQKSIGTCVVWICDSSGTVCDIMVGLPDSKLLIEKAKAAAQFLFSSSQRNYEEFATWHRNKVQPTDQQFFDTVQARFLANDKTKESSLTVEETIKHSIAAAAKSRELWMEQRFGGNWNHQTLTRFAQFENQFFSMMLANIPFRRVKDLEEQIWKIVVGKRIWKIDRDRLTKWIEEQRSQRLPILLRLKALTRDETWPRPGAKKLANLVDRYAVLDDANPADAAFLLSYFKAKPLTISAHHLPTYFVSTSRGDICHLLTAKNDKRLTELLASINITEAKRRK